MKYNSTVQSIFDILSAKDMTISFCESASAGSLTNIFCEIENVSKIFKGSIIAYNNQIKIDVVKIQESLISNYGAVSKEVAIAMAKNTNKIFNTDVCVSITGNASCINPIENKPTGKYYVGIALFDKVYYFEVNLENGERNFNRLNISLHSLDLLLKLLYECEK
ncbi:MAG: CinA family protein [Mycoplasma sp.]